MSASPPAPDDLQRELERVRAAQPEAPSAPQPTIGQHLRKSALRFVLLWLVLIAAFLAIRSWLD